MTSIGHNGAGADPDAPVTYRDSGVDIDAGNALVAAIKPLVKATRRPGADADLGGFGGLFDLKAAGYKDPILVAANGGVGTRPEFAIVANQQATIGVALVAMCVNDLLVQGAEPLFFLDYFSTGKLDVAMAREVIAGIAAGCREAGCALIGGETAEMPGMYGGGDYDLAGFAVGAVERGHVLPRGDIEVGDILIGLPSSGVHSNGYSLVRKLVAAASLEWDAPAPFAADMKLAAALLTPTRIYVKSVLAAIRATGGSGPGGAVKALAHITGGGLSENIPRIMPDHVCAAIDVGSWAPPAVFGWLKSAGNLDDTEMLRTFNCGIGLVIVAERERGGLVLKALRAAGEAPMCIGRVAPARGVLSEAKGKGQAEAVDYAGQLRFAP